uniref:WIYLD domain-containing protein n=1 Tax=Oryza punctata TaxID=4537 RepID=A0A0E0LYA4_ORYPU
MGYATADIRTVVKDLLKVYGDNGWPFLEEGSYRVVQEALFDKEEQLQLQLLQQEEEHQQPQQLDGAMEDAPIENNMPIVEMHEVPAEAEPTVEEMQEALFQKQKEEQLQLQLFQHEEEQEEQQPQVVRSLTFNLMHSSLDDHPICMLHLTINWLLGV